MPDPSHGVHNNIELGISRCGLREHQHMALICRNVQHGPWAESRRYWEVRTALSEVFASEDPLHCPLYTAMLPLILADMQMEHRIGDETVEKEVWQTMQDDGPWNRKGCHQHPSRFLAPVRLAKAEMPLWHLRCSRYTYASIELGFLSGSELQKLVLTMPQADMEGPGARMRGPGLEDCRLETHAMRRPLWRRHLGNLSTPPFGALKEPGPNPCMLACRLEVPGFPPLLGN